MKPFKFYETIPDMECLQGDTLSVFAIEIEDIEDLTGYSMKLILEEQFSHREALSKNCNIAENVFQVQLTSEDTAKLSGIYQMHFCLTDTNGLNHRKLEGVLHVKATSQGE